MWRSGGIIPLILNLRPSIYAALNTHSIGDWMAPIAGLDALDEIQIS
jgi:hypothetical protein